MFLPANPTKEISGNTIGVTLSANFPGIDPQANTQLSPDRPKLRTLINKTDATYFQSLDPETLEPIGVGTQTILDPSLVGPLSAAHARVCPATGDIYNYNLEFSRGVGIYRFFHVSAKSGRTTVLATIQETPAYLHSLFLTDHYVILCVWNAHFAGGGIKSLSEQNFVDALSDFDTTKPAKCFVIDRSGGRGVVATYCTDAFFCFHSINAWEEPDTRDPRMINIIADMCAYESLDCLKRFYMDNLISNCPSAKEWMYEKRKAVLPHFRRLKLSNVADRQIGSFEPRKAEVLIRSPTGIAPELPAIHPRFKGKKYRFSYGLRDTGNSTFFDGLIKYDADSQQVVDEWSKFAQTAAEPIFIADPGDGDEDEENGVLLTVVLDGTDGESYLLVIDAKTMTEVGRAHVGNPVGFGFHGTWWSDGGMIESNGD